MKRTLVMVTVTLVVGVAVGLLAGVLASRVLSAAAGVKGTIILQQQLQGLPGQAPSVPWNTSPAPELVSPITRG